MESCPKPQPLEATNEKPPLLVCYAHRHLPLLLAPGTPFEDSGEVAVAGVCCGVCVGLCDQRNLGNMAVFSRCVLVLQVMGDNLVSWALFWDAGSSILKLSHSSCPGFQEGPGPNRNSNNDPSFLTIHPSTHLHSPPSVPASVNLFFALTNIYWALAVWQEKYWELSVQTNKAQLQL